MIFRLAAFVTTLASNSKINSVLPSVISQFLRLQHSFSTVTLKIVEQLVTYDAGRSDVRSRLMTALRFFCKLFQTQTGLDLDETSVFLSKQRFFILQRDSLAFSFY